LAQRSTRFPYTTLFRSVAFSQGFASLLPLDPITIDAGVGTSDKSQAKVFKYDGKHWAILAVANDGVLDSGTHLFRLDGTSWTQIDRKSTRLNSSHVKI